MSEPLAVRMTQLIMQEIAHKVSALLSSYPPQAHVFLHAIVCRLAHGLATPLSKLAETLRNMK